MLDNTTRNLTFTDYKSPKSKPSKTNQRIAFDYYDATRQIISKLTTVCMLIMLNPAFHISSQWQSAEVTELGWCSAKLGYKLQFFSLVMTC